MQHSLAAGALFELLLDHQESPGGNAFKFDFGTVLQELSEPDRTGDGAIDRMAQQDSLQRERLMGSGTDFGQDMAVVFERDQVSRRRNMHGQPIVGSLDDASEAGIVELRVNRPCEHVEAEFGNFGSDGDHGVQESVAGRDQKIWEGSRPTNGSVSSRGLSREGIIRAARLVANAKSHAKKSANTVLTGKAWGTRFREAGIDGAGTINFDATQKKMMGWAVFRFRKIFFAVRRGPFMRGARSQIRSFPTANRSAFLRVRPAIG